MKEKEFLIVSVSSDYKILPYQVNSMQMRFWAAYFKQELIDTIDEFISVASVGDFKMLPNNFYLLVRTK